jgi:hypothetical protein
MATDREHLLFLARAAEYAERYADALTAMKGIISLSSTLASDDGDLLSRTFKALTLSRRSALRTIDAYVADDSVTSIQFQSESRRSWR